MPCTYWSIAKRNRETDCGGEGFRLFMQYVRALEETGAKYFLYENNYSIHRNIKDEISKRLGVQPIMINSALVSVQQRKRCYWTNIPGITQHADKGIFLKDIIDNAVPWQGKSYCLTANYGNAYLKNTLERHQRSMVAVPIRIGDIGSNAQDTGFIPCKENRFLFPLTTEVRVAIRDCTKSTCRTVIT